MQVLPSGDDFSEWSPVYDTVHRGYCRTGNRFAANLTVNGSLYPVTFLWASTTVWGFHDGYSTFSVTSGMRSVLGSVSTLGALSASTASPTTNYLPAAMLFRPYQVGYGTGTTSKVSLGFYVHRLAGGALQEDMIRFCGVLARISAGVVINPGAASHEISEPDFYMLGLVNSTANNAYYILMRSAGGTPTLLAYGSEIGGVTPTGSFDILTEFRMDLPTVLRLEVSDEAGDVRLRGYRQTNNPIQSYGTQSGFNELLVIDYLDNSGGKLTNAGNFGFCMHTERTVSSVKSQMLATLFQIEQGSSVILRDEFQRESRTYAATVPAASGYTGGKSLSSAWVGDFDSDSTISIESRVRVSTPAGLTNRAMVDPVVKTAGSAGAGNEYLGGYFLHQRSASNPISSRRSTTFRISTNKADGTAGTSTTARLLGVFARGGLVTLGNYLSRGYCADVQVGIAGVAKATIRRFSSSPQVIATIAQNITTFSLTADADHTIDLEVYNQEDSSGDPQLAIVTLILKVDGTQVVLTVPSGNTGVTSAAVGTIYDNASTKILSGTGEGIHVRAPDGTAVVYFDGWTAGSLQNPGETSDNDLTVIAVNAESAGFTGTLDVPYDWPVREGVLDPMDSAEMEDGYWNTARRFGRSRRMWEIEMASDAAASLTTLRDFWNAREGGEVAFSWTPPLASATVKVCFYGEDLEHALNAPSVVGYRFKLLEIF